MSGQLDLAKSKHDTNRKIYAGDAEVEDDFKYWKDITEIQEGYKEIDELKLNNSKKSNSFGGETLNRENDDSDQISMEEYMNIDQQVSDANIDVANAIAKNPGTDGVGEAREKFVTADQARDELSERIANMNASNNIETTIPNVSVNASGKSKLELTRIKNELEKRCRELDRQYSKLENQAMNGQPIDTAQLSRIKAERQAINKELEKVYIELNK